MTPGIPDLQTQLNIILSQSTEWSEWLLSLLNRDSSSPEYGCFDRYFWHYRTEREFPAATFQYLVLALTSLYLGKGSQLRGDPNIRNLICAAINFWAKIQRRDGTFDEWLPFEQSHVATAFTLYHVTESLLLMKEAGQPIDLDVKLTTALEKAGSWLSRHHDRIILNHTAGALAALYNLFLLTGDSVYRTGYEAALKVLADSQTSEGWFPEYGGADPGYTSVSIDFLASFWYRSKDERGLRLLAPALDFLEHFIHPDGSSGGVYGSRNTRYILPRGLLLLSERPVARRILAAWAKGQTSGKGLGLRQSDDRYRGFFLCNWLMAWRYLVEMSSLALEEPGRCCTGEINFHQAGLLKVSREDLTFICGLRKLGVFELFFSGGTSFADGGYCLLFKDKSRATTQWPDPQVTFSWDSSACLATVSGRFGRVSNPAIFHRALLPHRLVSHLLGCMGSGGGRINHRIKAAFIKPLQPAPATFKRHIHLLGNGVKVEDDISWAKPAQKLIWTSGCGHMHVPSSNFFTPGHDRQEQFDVTNTKQTQITTIVTPEGVHRRLS